MSILNVPNAYISVPYISIKLNTYYRFIYTNINVVCRYMAKFLIVILVIYHVTTTEYSLV